MLQNKTPTQIALLASAILSVLLFAVIFIVDLFVHSIKSPAIYLLTFLFAFGISYLLFYYTIGEFIYNKIKLVYNTIYNIKTAREFDLKDSISNSNVLNNVSEEVLIWAENKKEEIEQLKKQENFRREFLGNVSHELKTPIFSIQGYIHTLLDGGLEDEHINMLYLEKASRSVDRLCAIVDDLEAISKLESGEMILEQHTFDIYELTKDVFDSLELKAREKNISLGFTEGSDKSFFVFADKERIRQVIVNLVVNSIKYGRQNSQTLVGFYNMDPNILIEVSDSGIGIDEKHLPRLFERFYRVDKSRSRDQGGTGLGLSIVKHIIEAHNQTISVRSKPGIGSTFGFTLKKA